MTGDGKQTHLDKVCDVSRCEALGWVQPVLVFVLFWLFSIFASWQHVVLVVLSPLQQAGVLHFTHLQYLVCCHCRALRRVRLVYNRVDLKHMKNVKVWKWELLNLINHSKTYSFLNWCDVCPVNTLSSIWECLFVNNMGLYKCTEKANIDPAFVLKSHRITDISNHARGLGVRISLVS